MNSLPSSLMWAIFVVVLSTGCSAAVGPEPEVHPTTNAGVIDSYLAEARTSELTFDSQIEALERARVAGEITRADVNEAFASHLACLDDAGIEYNVIEEEMVPGSGVSRPAVTLPVTDPGSTREVDIDDACSFGHDIYIISAYVMQPWVRAAGGEVWTSPAVRSCLADRGYTTDDDVTAAEVRDLHNEYSMNNWDKPGFEPCVTESG